MLYQLFISTYPGRIERPKHPHNNPMPHNPNPKNQFRGIVEGELTEIHYMHPSSLASMEQTAIQAFLKDISDPKIRIACQWNRDGRSNQLTLSSTLPNLQYRTGMQLSSQIIGDNNQKVDLTFVWDNRTEHIITVWEPKTQTHHHTKIKGNLIHSQSPIIHELLLPFDLKEVLGPHATYFSYLAQVDNSTKLP